MPTLAVRLSAHAALAAGVFCLCYGAIVWFPGEAGLAAVWPANALILAYKLRACETRGCSRTALAMALAAMVAANLTAGRAIVPSLLFPLANGVEILIAAWMLRRVSMPMAEFRDLGRFILGGVVAGPAASATMAAAVMAITLGLRDGELLGQAAAWFAADATGMAIIAPFALSLTRTRLTDAWATLALPLAIGAGLYFMSHQIALPVLALAFPLVTLAVLRDRDSGGALSVGAVAFAVVAAAIEGVGAVPRLAAMGADPVLFIQVFLAALVMTAHPLAVAMKRLDVLTAEATARRAEAEAESLRRGRILARAGSDLRSPLTGVLTVAEMLRSGRLGELNDKQRELLACIAAGGAEIEQLSREMLAPGDLDPQGRAVDLGALLSETAAGLRFLARRHGARLDVSAPDGIFPIAAPSAVVGAALRDVLARSLREVSQGGRVVAALEQAPGGARLILDRTAGAGSGDWSRLIDLGARVAHRTSPMGGRRDVVDLPAARDTRAA